MRVCRFVLCLAAGLAFLPVAAQPSTFDKDLSNLALLRIDAVKKELKLAADQTKKLAAIETEYNSELAKLRQGKTPPTTKQMQDAARKSKEKSFAVLSQHQGRRLREITLQTLGPLGVMNPPVQAKLNLSKVQKTKLNDAIKKYAPKMAEVAKTASGSSKLTPEDIKKRQAAVDKIQKELAEVVRGILTPAQLKQYRGLVGKPCPGLRMAARVPL